MRNIPIALVIVLGLAARRGAESGGVERLWSGEAGALADLAANDNGRSGAGGGLVVTSRLRSRAARAMNATARPCIRSRRIQRHNAFNERSAGTGGKSVEASES